MTTPTPATERQPPCGARPIHGTASCDLPAGHDAPPPHGDSTRHSAPLAIGGRLSFAATNPLHPGWWSLTQQEAR